VSYPDDIDDFTPKTDNASDVMAADINELQTAIEAIETAIGENPEADDTDLVTRLAHSINGDGMLEFDAATELTIAAGAITVTQNYHTVDTQSDAASDDLDTISGGTAGMWVIIRAADGARSVVIKHGVDNIYTYTGADITLAEVYQFAQGFYDAALSKWFLR
jgi:hypothetical protein